MKTVLVFMGIAGAHGLDCSAGNKHKATLTNLYCSRAFDTHLVQAGSTFTSDQAIASFCSTCCTNDPLKCGGQTTITCGTDKYNGGLYLTGSAKDAWKNKATTSATVTTDCCETLATCGSTAYTCPAGYKKVTANAATKCSGDVSTCKASLGTLGCCELDALTCGGIGMLSSDCTGVATTYLPSGSQADDTWKAKVTAAASKVADCCKVKAKCSAATCPAGYKMKDGVATTDCTSDAASCAPTALEQLSLTASTCCEADTTKCGGNSVTCAGTEYTYGSGTTKINAWKNTAAGTNGANKATACCTTKATCTAYTCPAGYKDKANKNTISCSTDADSCSKTTCCDLDALKCGGNTAAATTCTATTHTDKCPSDATVTCATSSTDSTYTTSCNTAQDTCRNTATTATALATAANNVCCEKLATCTEFKAKVATTNTLVSGTYQLRPVLTMAMAVIAFLSVGQK